MIIKDGDFYSAITHLKNAMANLEDGNIEVAKVQIEAVDICLKSAITDELDEDGEVDMTPIICEKCGSKFSRYVYGVAGCCLDCAWINQ